MIRAATPNDAAGVSRLMIQAMEDMVIKYLNGHHSSKAVPLLHHFFSLPANIYSFENALVYEDGQGIGGSVTAYDGADFIRLRKPVLDFLKKEFSFEELPEHETAAGEYYIDTLSVFPNRQGKGIGTQLLLSIAEKAAGQGFSKLSLLVDRANTDAKRLYTKLHFEPSEALRIMGTDYERLIKRLDGFIPYKSSRQKG